MNMFKNKNIWRIIEAQIVQELKNNETRPKFDTSYKHGTLESIFIICYSFLFEFI